MTTQPPSSPSTTALFTLPPLDPPDHPKPASPTKSLAPTSPLAPSLSLEMPDLPPLPPTPTLDAILGQGPMQVLTPHEARTLARDLVLLVMSCVPHGSIAPDHWWQRAESALGAGLQAGEDAEGVVAQMLHKLQIQEVRHEAANSLCLIYERLRAPAIFSRWRSECDRKGMTHVIVGEAKAHNTARKATRAEVGEVLRVRGPAGASSTGRDAKPILATGSASAPLEDESGMF